MAKAIEKVEAVQEVKFEVMDIKQAYAFYHELNIQFRKGMYATSDEKKIAYLRGREEIKEVK